MKNFGVAVLALLVAIAQPISASPISDVRYLTLIGGRLWFSLPAVRKIGYIDRDGCAYARSTPLHNDGPFGIAFDTHGTAYFTDPYHGMLDSVGLGSEASISLPNGLRPAFIASTPAGVAVVPFRGRAAVIVDQNRVARSISLFPTDESFVRLLDGGKYLYVFVQGAAAGGPLRVYAVDSTTEQVQSLGDIGGGNPVVVAGDADFWYADGTTVTHFTRGKLSPFDMTFPVYSLAVSSGSLYVGSRESIYEIDDKGNVTASIPLLGFGSIVSMTADDGGIVYGTDRGYIGRLSRDGRVDHQTIDQMLLSSIALCRASVIPYAQGT